MADIKIVLANEGHRNKLLQWFKHYKAREIIENRVDCYLSHNFTIIAEDDGKIVGVTQWRVKEDPKAGVVEFEEVYVSEDYRREGIGYSLIQSALHMVKEYFKRIGIKPRRVFLFVGKNNKNAIALYKKCGFKLVSEVKWSAQSANDIEVIYNLEL